MAEIFFTLFLFIAITVITAALFGGWVIFSVIRAIWHVIETVFSPTGRSRSRPSPIAIKYSAMRTCANVRCKTLNPSDAHFCRRCGQYLPQPQRVAVRRAAMW
jgi:hypothetical protein